MKLRKKTVQNSEPNLDNLLMNFSTNSRYAESFRTLRTNLNFTSMEKELKSVLVTSSVEAEGKTNTVINLGHTIAQTGKKVLLIDADLRRPFMTDTFSLKKEKGFTDIISDTLRTPISKGDIKDYSIGDLIELIKLQQKSGELNIESDENSIAIYFDHGKIVDIYWKNRPESKKLANILTQKKLLTREEAKLALGHQKKSVQRLGTILFSMGLVTKKELSKELAVQAVEVMRLISVITEGSFHFKPLYGNLRAPSILQNVNFKELFKEFLDQGEELQFISNSIVAAIHTTEVENLFVLPSGKIPPNPSELIGSKSAEFLIEVLKKEFDFIILDTPPVMPATDALVLAPRTDGTILVVKSGNTEKKVLIGVIESFKNAKLPILGVLLNQVDLKKEGYYRYYNKYYSSYYGE